MSTTTTLFGSAEAQAARTLIGGTTLGDTRNELLKQILVATANKAGGSSSVAFADITGAPTDNTALAAALAAKLDLAGGTMTGALAITAGALNTAALSGNQTWNNAGVTCRGFEFVVNDVNSAADSTACRFLGGAAGTSHLLALQKDGTLTIAQRIITKLNTNLELVNSGMFNRLLIGSQNDPSNGISVYARIISAPSDAAFAFSSNIYSEGASDVFLRRGGAAILQLGTLHATTPIDQTLAAHSVTTGTGASLTLQGGDGSVARGNVVLNGGNRAPYDAAPSSTIIRDILISHGLMADS